MITEEEMYRIQAVRAGKAYQQARKGTYNPIFPLRKTVYCGFCNNPLTASAPRGNGGLYYYYHCYTKTCTAYAKNIRKQDLESEFLDYLKEITPTEDFLIVFKETCLNVWKEKLEEHTVNRSEYEKELKKLEQRKKQICEMMETGTYDAQLGQERLEEMKNKIIATKISLSEARIDELDVEATLTYASKFIKDLARQWIDLGTAMDKLQPQFQKLVLPNGIPYTRGEGFGTADLGLIFELYRQYDGDKSLVVEMAGIEPACRRGKNS